MRLPRSSFSHAGLRAGFFVAEVGAPGRELDAGALEGAANSEHRVI